MEKAEESRTQAEEKRNEKVDNAISEIKDMTADYNENAENKTNEFNQNSATKVEEFNINANLETLDFNNNAEQKEEEINTIADGVRDMATSIQFATFEVDNNMDLIINTADKLKNTSFEYDEETGELEVEITNG